MAPANFKTYEAQARLLRAIVAAHPEVKWNYKEIAKFFGESTTDGIQFQFRGIKKDAESLKQTANSGGNPATALNLPASATSSAFSTPRKPRTPSTKTRVSGGGRSTTAKKTKQVRPVAVSEEDDEEDEEIDYNEVEDTPSKSRVRDRILDGRVSKNTHTPNPRRSATPSRAATIAAAANIAQAAAVDLTTSDSDANTSDNAAGYDTPAPIDAKPVVMQQQTQLLLADPTPAYEQPIAHPAVQPAIQPATQPAIQPTHNGDYSSHSSFDHSQGTAPFNDDSLIFSFVETMEHGNGDFNPYMGNDGEI